LVRAPPHRDIRPAVADIGEFGEPPAERRGLSRAGEVNSSVAREDLIEQPEVSRDGRNDAPIRSRRDDEPTSARLFRP